MGPRRVEDSLFLGPFRYRKGDGMNEKLQYPLWQQPLVDAIVDIEYLKKRTHFWAGAN
jgi:hypothetical protein